MASGSSHPSKRAARPQKKGIRGAKMLISAAAFAATVGGWVAFAASEQAPDVSASASPALSSQAPVPITRVVAPQPERGPRRAG
jgi:hypothetical protein